MGLAVEVNQGSQVAEGMKHGVLVDVWHDKIDGQATPVFPSTCPRNQSILGSAIDKPARKQSSSIPIRVIWHLWLESSIGMAALDLERAGKLKYDPFFSPILPSICDVYEILRIPC
jgi:hypothetical protein